MPSSILYLIDCSASMVKSESLIGLVGTKLDLVKKSVSEALGNKSEFGPGDRVAVISFRSRQNEPRVRTVIPFQYVRSLTSRYSMLIGDISGSSSDEAAPLSVAMTESLQQLKNEHESKGIVFITDGPKYTGGDPRLCIYDALIEKVRIDIVGIGESIDTPLLESISKKTGGSFRKVIYANDLRKAIIWRRATLPLDSDTAQLINETASIMDVLNKLEEDYQKSRIEKQQYLDRKGDLTSSLLVRRKEIIEKRAEASRSLAALNLERQDPLIQLTDLKYRLDRNIIGKKTYLRKAEPLEDLMADLVQKIAMQQQILDAIDASQFSGSQPMPFFE